MNKFTGLFIALGILASCGQGSNKQGTADGQEILPVTVAEFTGDAGPFADRIVQIHGTVVHVCRHGGQKMYIIGEDGEDRVRITAGEDIPEFRIDLEGEKVEVTGIVRELVMDETYLAEWEAEVMEGSGKGHGDGTGAGAGQGVHAGESRSPARAGKKIREQSPATADAEAPEVRKEAQLARIQKVRNEIAESGKDHLSEYWIETVEFKVIKD